MWDLIYVETFLSWVHDRFTRLMHGIFHAISLVKEDRFCWIIHIYTETHGKVLKIIAYLDSYVNDFINPVIQGTPM